MQFTLKGIQGTLKTPAGDIPVKSRLLGGHNLENILAAAGLALLPTAVRPVLVLVDVEATTDRLQRRLAARLEGPVLTLGHDRGLAAEGAFDARRLRARTRRELIAIGRVVVEQAVLSARPGPR